MKRILTSLAILMTPAPALSQGIEVEMRCISFLDIYMGRVTTDLRTLGYIEGYIQGAASTMKTTQMRAERVMQEACDENPQFTMRQAVLEAQKRL